MQNIEESVWVTKRKSQPHTKEELTDLLSNETVNKMRYFFFSACFKNSFMTTFANFFWEKEDFPSMKEFKNYTSKECPGAKNIVILSITELSKENYDKLTSEL